MNVVMIERFIFERSGGRARALHPGWTSPSGSPGSIRRIASTRLLRRCRIGQELRYPQQTVTADRQHRHEACAAIAAHPHLAHRPSVLTPAKGFLDAFADTLARPIAPVARGARIDRGTAGAGAVLCYVWGDAQRAALGDELAGVVGFVCRQRAAGALSVTFHQPDARLALGEARRFGELHIDRQALAVLHQQVSHVIELSQMPLALAKELRLRLVRGHVRLVRAPLAMEVHVRVAPRGRRIILAIATAHALDRRPRLNEGAIDAEVFRGQQSFTPCPPADGTLIEAWSAVK